jgi:hypothetical protein
MDMITITSLGMRWIVSRTSSLYRMSESRLDEQFDRAAACVQPGRESEYGRQSKVQHHGSKGVFGSGTKWNGRFGLKNGTERFYIMFGWGNQIAECIAIILLNILLIGA